ncbi:hypothetical protein [Actinoplanes aureus]|uniref:Uncharacterized protein n=1 Tax=Actinoplanes aureus TaxID=2792083 RepID=A0A931FUX4_9ACTN|nr:hypothetical protein [Actinoplanes aureus]MBG0560698.1 hypothetical protein [Actinoplanes aureus]
MTFAFSSAGQAVAAGVLVAIALLFLTGALVTVVLVWFTEPTITTRPADTEPDRAIPDEDTAVYTTRPYPGRHRAVEVPRG